MVTCVCSIDVSSSVFLQLVFVITCYTLYSAFEQGSNCIFNNNNNNNNFFNKLIIKNNFIHPIHLNKEFHRNWHWWHQFLVDWHGVSFWLFPRNRPTAGVEVSSDAGGSLGFGAYLEGMWFTGSWMFSQREQSIAYKELFPVVIAAHVRGHQWCRRHVLF